MNRHPFRTLLEKEIARSHGDENKVLGEACRLMDEGYPPQEIYDVLVSLKKSLIDPFDEAILNEAAEDFEQYLNV